MILERTYTAEDIRKYRDETGAGMMDAKRHFEQKHQERQRAVLHAMINQAEINKDFSLIVGALKILAERY